MTRDELVERRRQLMAQRDDVSDRAWKYRALEKRLNRAISAVEREIGEANKGHVEDAEH